ncbi:hypothetical protein ACFIQF_18550 [Comamonas sp. J-3]|uniref:hypothetical protein n=1 Tax=Comamonas trifloxystrobinivorans TaxID=3350256 RepID=UPI0037291C71
MLDHSNSQPHSQPDLPFFEALVAHLIDGAMIPKVQVERSIGPVLGFFMADVLTTLLDNGSVVMLSPEFPIRKLGNMQSTNIDWLMLNLTTNELLLVELKTTDTTFRAEQAAIYEELQARIQAESAEFLLTELMEIGNASQERGKYQRVRQLMIEAYGVQDEEQLSAKLRACRSSQVIYLAPKVMSRPDSWTVGRDNWQWLSFGDLPGTLAEGAYADQWPALHKQLLMLDAMDRHARNGTQAGGSRKNYLELLDYADLLKVCRQQGASKLVGFMGGSNKLQNTDLPALQNRSFKVDDIANLSGKVLSNWIRGDQFVALIDSKAAQ